MSVMENFDFYFLFGLLVLRDRDSVSPLPGLRILSLHSEYLNSILYIKSILEAISNRMHCSPLFISPFTNIAPYTTCHVHHCELLFPEHLSSETTMVNIWWWCYN